MLLALGAVSSAVEALQSLTSKASSGAPAVTTVTSTAPFEITGNATASDGACCGPGSYSQLSPQTLGALIAAQSRSGSTGSVSASASAALQDLFSQIDANGDGTITKAEFENALGAGGTNLAKADDVFAKLDSSGDGSVSLEELSKALQGHHRHHPGSAGGAGIGNDALAQALQGASTASVTNGDGSTTTSITYADGSKVALTAPPASSSSSSATSSYNLIERLILYDSKALPAAAPFSVSV